MKLNKEDGGNRKFIMVQLPEKCGEKNEAFKADYKTIADIGQERIRRTVVSDYRPILFCTPSKKKELTKLRFDSDFRASTRSHRRRSERLCGAKRPTRRLRAYQAKWGGELGVANTLR